MLSYDNLIELGFPTYHSFLERTSKCGLKFHPLIKIEGDVIECTKILKKDITGKKKKEMIEKFISLFSGVQKVVYDPSKMCLYPTKTFEVYVDSCIDTLNSFLG